MRTTRSRTAIKGLPESLGIQSTLDSQALPKISRAVEEATQDRKPENHAKERALLRPQPTFLADPSLHAESKESDSSIINGSSMEGTLHNNPLCDLVEKYSNLRRTHISGQQKPKLAQFIKTFEEAMVS